LLPSKDGKGRVAALEVLVGVPALRNLIREDKTVQIQSVIQTGTQHGMQSLDQSLRELFMAGKLSREEAMKKSSNPRLFESAGAGGTGSGTPSGTGNISR
jgi:twitching motility protein PilT